MGNKGSQLSNKNLALLARNADMDESQVMVIPVIYVIPVIPVIHALSSIDHVSIWSCIVTLAQGLGFGLGENKNVSAWGIYRGISKRKQLNSSIRSWYSCGDVNRDFGDGIWCDRSQNVKKYS